MARGARPLGLPPAAAPGRMAAVAVAGLLLAPLAAVIWRAGFGAASLGAADWAAVRFTLWQAFLSAGFSVLLALPVARALARQSFPGRGLLVTLLGAPFLLPVIVAVLGLLAVFGRAGWVNDALGWVGLPEVSIYGLSGVVLAHVFFNLPLAARLILQGWADIPGERFRMAAQLGLTRAAVFRVIERPMLREVVPGAFLVIFLVCLSSFAVALILGGGPRATTVELAIYQAFRFDFDLGRAALLALVQLGLAMGAGMIALRIALPQASGAGLDRVPQRWDARGTGVRAIDAGWLGLTALFLLTPLLAIALRGLPEVASLPGSVWRAAATSIGVALVSTALCLMLALPLATLRAGWVSLLGLAISPLVIGTGAFVILRPVTSPPDWALPVTALVNALMALPFAVRALAPTLEQTRRAYGRLSAQLGLTGWAWWRRVGLPRARRPLGFAAGLTAALSMGDLGVIALFADPERATLPLQMFRLMGAYRMDAAAGAAVLLVALTLALFWVFDRGGRGHA